MTDSCKKIPLYYFFYNTVVLDRMRICTSPNISDPLGIIEKKTWYSTKKTNRRTEVARRKNTHPMTCFMFR